MADSDASDASDEFDFYGGEPDSEEDSVEDTENSDTDETDGDDSETDETDNDSDDPDKYGGDDLEDTEQVYTSLPEQGSADPSQQIHQEIIVVAPENRRTSSMMNRFELTEAISIRTAQLAARPTAMTDTSGLDNPCDMAKKEISDGKCPLILRRAIAHKEDKATNRMITIVEDWDVNKMSKPEMFNM